MSLLDDFKSSEQEKSVNVLQIKLKGIQLQFVIDIAIRVLFCYLALSKQISLIQFIIFFLALSVPQAVLRFALEKKNKKKLRAILTGHSSEEINEIKYLINDEIIFYHLLVGLIFSYWYAAVLITMSHWYNIFLILLAGGVGTICFAIAAELNSLPRSFTPITIKVLKRTPGSSNEKPVIIEDISYLYNPLLLGINTHFNPYVDIGEIDSNDTKIAKLESDLKDMNTKTESYMLESVLIGSLTFSGFLGILCSGLNFNFNQTFSELGQIQIFNTTTDLVSSLKKFSSQENLFPLILVGSLSCSVFFILILSLRMRYSSLSLKLDYLIRILNIFNSKEEELINLQLTGAESETIRKRKSLISKKINQALKDSNDLMLNIKPTYKIMGAYRSVGLFLFYIVLVIGGLFVSPYFSLGILMVAIFTIIYKQIEAYFRNEIINRLLRRH